MITRDEILNLKAGREMDALIAERIMGWTLHPNKTHWGKPHPGMDNFSPSFEWRQVGDFEPSTDISAAWEVVDRIVKLPATVNVQTSNAAGGSICYVQKYPSDLNCIIFEAAPTATLAICRAAMLAISEDK